MSQTLHTINVLESDLTSALFEIKPIWIDNGIGFKIHPSGDIDALYEMEPSEELRFALVPSETTLTWVDISGILNDINKMQPSVTSGLYFAKFDNTDASQKSIEMFIPIVDQYDWENTKFDLYWLQLRSDDNYCNFDSFNEEIYSFPHKIVQDEVKLFATINNLLSESTLSLTFTLRNILNDDAADYTSNGPYSSRVNYSDGDTCSGIVYYDQGYAGSGLINVLLPFYDSRKSGQEVPGQYILYLNNVWAGELTQTQADDFWVPANSEFGIVINSNDIGEGFKSLTKPISQPSPDNIQKIDGGDVQIPANIINRRRCSVGIKDIALVKNDYYSNGYFISEHYSLDFSLYTFSLKVIEDLKEYPNVNKYDTVKYYVEFNSQKWIRVSPITRGDEYENGKLVPKLIIIDKIPDSTEFNNTLYIPYETDINVFRIKIAFDLSMLENTNIVTPEVFDYKCIIFDKTSLGS